MTALNDWWCYLEMIWRWLLLPMVTWTVCGINTLESSYILLKWSVKLLIYWIVLSPQPFNDLSLSLPWTFPILTCITPASYLSTASVLFSLSLIKFYVWTDLPCIFFRALLMHCYYNFRQFLHSFSELHFLTFLIIRSSYCTAFSF